MKRLIIIFLLFYYIVNNDQLSNEFIWASGTFYPKMIRCINSTADGLHYTSQKKVDGTKEIINTLILPIKRLPHCLAVP